jgi:hypothetical protein
MYWFASQLPATLTGKAGSEALASTCGGLAAGGRVCDWSVRADCVRWCTVVRDLCDITKTVDATPVRRQFAACGGGWRPA